MVNLVEIKKIKPAVEDEKGIISDIVIGKKIQHVGIITSKANTLRGNHYHKLSTQYNYILRGKIELTVKDAKNDQPEKGKVILAGGDIVTIPHMTIHALKALEDSVFLVLTSEARIGQDYENDTFRV